MVDPLPAGLEVRRIERSSLWEHYNLRDDRVEAFQSTLLPGIYQLSYLARATTHGRFVAPPARAEEMYAPETFGRAESDLVWVE